MSELPFNYELQAIMYAAVYYFQNDAAYLNKYSVYMLKNSIAY